MTIPILAPNLISQAAQQRHDVFNADRQNAENRAAAKKAFTDKLVGTFVDAGLQAAQNFGLAAYKESTEGDRAERQLNDNLKTGAHNRGMDLLEKGIDQPRATPMDTAPSGGFKSAEPTAERRQAELASAAEEATLPRRETAMAREIRSAPPIAPELEGLTKPYAPTQPVQAAPAAPPRAVEPPTAPAPTGFLGRPTPPPAAEPTEPSDVAFRRMAEGRVGLYNTPKEALGTGSGAPVGDIGSGIANASKSTAQRIAALTPDPTWTPEQVAIQQALWRQQAATRDKSVADAEAARKTAYTTTITGNRDALQKALETRGHLTPKFSAKNGRATFAPTKNVDLQGSTDAFGNWMPGVEDQSVSMRGGGGGGKGSAAFTGGEWDKPIVVTSTKPAKGSDLRGSTNTVSVSFGSAWADTVKNPTWHGLSPDDVKTGQALAESGDVGALRRFYDGMQQVHVMRLAQNSEGRTTSQADVENQAAALEKTTREEAKKSADDAAAIAIATAERGVVASRVKAQYDAAGNAVTAARKSASILSPAEKDAAEQGGEAPPTFGSSKRAAWNSIREAARTAATAKANAEEQGKAALAVADAKIEAARRRAAPVQPQQADAGNIEMTTDEAVRLKTDPETVAAQLAWKNSEKTPADRARRNAVVSARLSALRQQNPR